MDNYQGDLTDIVRASGGALAQSHHNGLVSNWEFPSDPLNLSSSSSSAMDDSNVFGDPFYNMRDPLLHELNVAGSCYFGSPSNSTDHMLSTSVDDTTSFSGANCTNNDTNNNHLLAHHKVFEDDQMNKSPCDIFSRIQISQNNPTKLPVSPCDSPVIAVAAASSPQGFNASSVVSIDMINTNSSKACLIDNTPPLQISSPRNLGIKRRKSQAKKVVCIPAPASANGRPSGEVVPSDLWAWRKYGQKPIKGSPYPRGYYRCSSSKGCSARKQVERSRTDPNMLVITYTSEHNHPWPTQRNALAGSTRSQPHKSIAASKSSPCSQPQNKTANTKEEQESSIDTHEQLLSPTMAAAASSTASAAVKEEIEDIEKQIEMDDAENQFSTEGYPYRPTMPDSNHNQSEDFFADLGEIEADPLDLLFSQGGFSGDPDKKESKILDPFSLFDWSGDNNNIINNNISFGEEEGKRGL